VAVKIKLKRLGKIHAPQYRIVIADSRTARNGRAIEEIGTYQPMADPSIIIVNSARVQYWLGVGAQPTESVTAILKVTGDWQKFKGLPGAEGTLRVAPPKVSKMVAYEAAVKEAASEPKATPRPKIVAAPEPVVVDSAEVAEVAAAIAEEEAVEAATAELTAEITAAEGVAADEAAVEAIVVAADEAAAEATEA
jgi:small subunit ribosomal protein S16